jgi:hypothetical protein
MRDKTRIVLTTPPPILRLMQSKPFGNKVYEIVSEIFSSCSYFTIDSDFEDNALEAIYETTVAKETDLLIGIVSSQLINELEDETFDLVSELVYEYIDGVIMWCIGTIEHIKVSRNSVFHLVMINEQNMIIDIEEVI